MTQCWICGSDRGSDWKPRSLVRDLTPEDLKITDDHYGATLALRRCESCEFIFAHGDDLRRLNALYEQVSDPAYLESQESRTLQTRWLLDQVVRANPTARTLLDIGAAAGLLVAEARRRGLTAVGVEPSHSLVLKAQQTNRVEVLQGVFPHARLTGRTFDVICAVDVIEHVVDPLQMLRDCARSLNAGGILVVVTPDIGSVAARLMGRRWWHFRPGHVGYFNETSMRRAAAAARLVAIRCFRARWFFSVGYIASRLTRYLPVGSLTGLLQNVPLVRRINQRVVPINLRDSMVVFLQREGAQ